MFRMLCIAVGVLLAMSNPAWGQASPSNGLTGNPVEVAPACPSVLDEAGKVIATSCRFCTLFRPGQVERFAITCPAGATQLDGFIADGFIPGDHWQLKVKIWDNNPNTAVATAPGPGGAFSTSARTYTYGTSVNALAECSYLHGVNVFPASSFIAFSAGCTVTPLGVTDEISRSP